MPVRGFQPSHRRWPSIENRGDLQRLVTAMIPDLGYEHVVLLEGNDYRGIDVAVLSRLPVFHRQSGRIIGVVNVHALLADETWEQVSQRLQPIERLDPGEPVSSAILRIQRSGLPMAVVAQKDGPMLGIVTLKDLLEEIVGELAVW